MAYLGTIAHADQRRPLPKRDRVTAAHAGRRSVDQPDMGFLRADGIAPAALARHGLSSAVDLSVFDNICQLAAQLCGADRAILALTDSETEIPIGVFGLSTQRAIDSAWPTDVAVTAPLTRSDDRTQIGTLKVLGTTDQPPTEAQQRGLETLADVAANSLEQLRSRTSARAAAHRFRAVLNTTPTGILVVDEAEILFANEATARMLGEAHPAELIGSNLTGRRIEEHQSGLLEATRQRYWRLLRSDGRELAAEVSSTAIQWGGRPAWHIELRDVSAEIEAFGDLAESESRYRRLADNSSDMITVQAEDGSYRFVSAGCLRLTGMTPEEIARLGHLDLIHPDDLSAVLDSHIQARTARVDSFTLTYRSAHRDGTWVPVESTIQLIRDAQGDVIEFQSNTRDITERVLVEQNRELADRRFRVAMDNAPIGMALLDLDGTLTEVNRALCELFGVQEQRLVGSRLNSLLHPEAVEVVTSQLNRLLQGEKESVEHETRYRRADGDYVWVLQTASQVRTNAGEPSYLIVQIQDITAWKSIEETLSRQALSDPLTGLANRLMLTQRLTHGLVAAKRRRSKVGLVFIDLDRFKAINDSLGHEAGDSILRQVAERLGRSIREEDTAVRLGGDEFVVLCEDLGGIDDLRLVSARIEAALNQPYRIGERIVSMTASIGLSVATAEDDADSLLRHSDAAMYEAKRRGRGRTQAYDGNQSSVPDKFIVEEELRSALQNSELRVHYQPVVRLTDGRILSHEALVRWQHPRRGLLAPSEFLDIAEDSALISEIGRWVLRRACEDTARVSGTDIAVNVSPRQLVEPGFADLVAQTLHSTGLDPGRLILEITETSILHATVPVIAATAAVTKLGVRFALDDFGTGQSSLTSLQKLPISFLKIDRSFTSQIGASPATERLITGILRLASSTGLSVVAEGVEELAQARFLFAQGCTDAQGYLYGRPEPLAAPSLTT